MMLDKGPQLRYIDPVRPMADTNNEFPTCIWEWRGIPRMSEGLVGFPTSFCWFCTVYTLTCTSSKCPKSTMVKNHKALTEMKAAEMVRVEGEKLLARSTKTWPWGAPAQPSPAEPDGSCLFGPWHKLSALPQTGMRHRDDTVFPFVLWPHIPVELTYLPATTLELNWH